MTRKITREDVIKTHFLSKVPNWELSEIPLGWNDGFAKGIIKSQVAFEGYQYVHNEVFEPKKTYNKYVELNLEIDPTGKLLNKALSEIENLPYFIEWKL